MHVYAPDASAKLEVSPRVFETGKPGDYLLFAGNSLTGGAPDKAWIARINHFYAVGTIGAQRTWTFAHLSWMLGRHKIPVDPCFPGGFFSTKPASAPTTSFSAGRSS